MCNGDGGCTNHIIYREGVLPEPWSGTDGGTAMDYVVLNLYDGLMNFFDTEQEALKASARDLEQYRHLIPNCSQRSINSLPKSLRSIEIQ